MQVNLLFVVVWPFVLDGVCVCDELLLHILERQKNEKKIEENKIVHFFFF